MIPYDKAAEEGFRSSTTEELLFYIENVEGWGKLIPQEKRQDPDFLRSFLLKKLGKYSEFEVRGAKAAPQMARSRVKPPYNLSFVSGGKYEGRRHRVVLNKPKEVTKGLRELFRINGYAIEMRYGHVENIPEAFWIMLRDTKHGIPKVEKRYTDGQLEQQTVSLEYIKTHSTDYRGVDEETKDRCATLIEWFRQQTTDPNDPWGRSDWWYSLTPSEIATAAADLDVIRTRRNPATGIHEEVPIETVRERCMIHCFSEVLERRPAGEPAPQLAAAVNL